MMFSFAIIPLLLLIGAAIDFGQATRVRAQLQNATDVAALSIARDGLSQPDTELPKIAAKYLNANWELPYTYKVDKLSFDRPTVTAVVDTTVKVPTTFLQLMGMKTIPVHAHSVTKGLGVEIALVLDTSGSMDESAGGMKKITALRGAANQFLHVMFGNSTSSERFHISVVPFSTAVNVGPSNQNASWMDNGGTPATSVHTENFAHKVNRFSLFRGGANGMRNVSWAGCVLSRFGAYATDDTPASSGETLFTPWFAPDQPDGDNYKATWPGKYDWRTGAFYNGQYWGFENDYLNDEGGNCTGADDDVKSQDEAKQARTCKYKNATADTSQGKGPNWGCTARPITPLTNARGDLTSAVNALQAGGNTNILEGFTWGWRTLSSGQPFNEGKPYNAPNNRKIIVLMTDGENYMGSAWNSTNLTFYSSFGFSKNHTDNERLGAPTNSESINSDRINDKTAAACANAKAKGIIVYTIAFDLDSAKAKSLLQKCASEPNAPFYNVADKSGDLEPVFLKIAESINALRIAQ